MPSFEFTSPEGKKYTVNGPDGATKEQAFQMLKTQLRSPAEAPNKAPSKPFGQKMNESISDIPRQVGLTARHGIEGAGGALDFLASPIRAGLNMVLPKKAEIQPANFSGVADYLGLPKPANATERVVGDVARTMAGAAVPISAASNIAKLANGTTQAVAKSVAANPVQQIASGASSGGAGGYVRETDGDNTSQLVASIAGGVAAPIGLSKLRQAGSAVKSAVTPKAVAAPAQIDIHIDQALKPSGLVIGDLPQNIQAAIRSDVAEAFKVNGSLSPDAVRRLADYRLTGATPTAATLTLDPAMVTQQKNLAKLGINSKDVAAQQLAQTENANNRQLITGLNALGANTSDDALAGGNKLINALAGRNDRAKAIIKQRYDAAKDEAGRSAALDPNAFATKADELLTQNLRNGELPADIRNRLNAFASGDVPLTVDTAEQFKTMMAKVQRTSADGGVREAISHVRSALDDAPLLDDQGQGAINAFNKARATNRTWMQVVERTPALQAVRDGIEPDKFVQQFVIGGGAKANLADLESLKASIKSSPEAMTAAKEQIAAHLKKSAINGAADEVGNFSQSAYNKALNAIGDQKLAMFFNKDEISQLRAIGRVASYEQFQPKGSAVNNSNTAGAALANILDRIAGSSLLSKVPFGNALSGPVQNIAVGMKSKQALDVPNALVGRNLLQQASKAPRELMISPAMFMGTSDEKKKNSLLP